MEGVEWTKVKYTYSRDTSRNPLNISLDINNKIQDYKIFFCTVYGGVLVEWGRVNQGD
jgi:hypothetical protein